MPYSQDRLYRSLCYWTAQIMPSGVVVVDGESYGIRMEDPSGQSPSVAVTLDSVEDTALELGSIGSAYKAVFTISARSRMQRDALKDIVRSGLAYNPIAVYSDFTDFIPSSGATVDKFAMLGDFYKATNMPNFGSDREAFFWNAVIFISLDVLGL